MSKLWLIYTIEYYTIFKKNESDPYVSIEIDI